MLLRLFKIGEVNYFCNEQQIKESGGLEEAAQKMAGFEMGNNPKPKPKPEPVKPEGNKPEEK